MPEVHFSGLEPTYLQYGETPAEEGFVSPANSNTRPALRPFTRASWGWQSRYVDPGCFGNCWEALAIRRDLIGGPTLPETIAARGCLSLWPSVAQSVEVVAAPFNARNGQRQAIWHHLHPRVFLGEHLPPCCRVKDGCVWASRRLVGVNAAFSCLGAEREDEGKAKG